MLKIISAAIVAASVMIAPAMAATVIKTEKTITHSQVLKPRVANANAHMVKKHHRYHVRPHHHTKRVIVKHRHYR